MSILNLSAKDINKEIPKKLKLENVGSNGEIYGDYYLDGKYQFRVKMPNIHGGSRKGLSLGLLRACRESVFLNASDYARLVQCPMSGEEYEEIIREKIKKGILFQQRRYMQ